jgi:pimeloyl-ACP methyl ester carboxylesterase
VFVRSAQIGTIDTTVDRDADGWLIQSSGRLAAPLDLVTRQLELRYDANWRPREMRIDATAAGQTMLIHTSVDGGNASSDVTAGGQPTQSVTEPIQDGAVFLPNPFFGAFEALAARVQNAADGTVIPIYSGPHGAYTATVGASATEQIQTVDAIIDARRINLRFEREGVPPLDVAIWTNPSGRLLRLSVPAQSLEVVRDDVGAVTARRVVMPRPNDEQVQIPALGFSLAGTISKPQNAPAGRLPAVVLVGGSGPTDRDEVVYNIPIFAELSSQLADAGFLVLRYDKRGVGQSGGRPESATLDDYAQDLGAAVKFLADRKDVDDRRIAVVGHSEGGSVAMIAADKEDKVRALVLIAAIGVTGADLNMAQIRHANEIAGRSGSELQATLELQKKIQDAVMSGTGWDGIEPQLRERADTPWFKSFLEFDPARQMREIDQPVMIVQGALDKQVDPSNADRLAQLAAARRKAPPPKVIKLPGINHLLVPAKTGEVSEYASLGTESISPEIARNIAEWLNATLPPRHR